MTKSKSCIQLFEKTRTLEEFNRIYIKIIEACNNKTAKTIMLSSCSESEGTSTIAANLSQIFAKKTNGNILLVDTNLRNPTLEKVFKVPKTPGLTNLISEKAVLTDIIKKTEVENLKLLTAGKWMPNPIPILSSDEITDYLGELKRSFQFIILDSAPIIPYSDSLYLSLKADIVLLVIEAEKTRWEVAQEAVKKLADVGVEVFGTILNKKKYHIPKIIYERL